VVSTSINQFGPMPGREKLVEMEKRYEKLSLHSLEKKNRYFPGFFVIWARPIRSSKKGVNHG
jgi:hypothetical protein